ncbi:hypothetical protein [Rossellomorea sp. BNER]|uniref:hypothetical protein n=1 Tax=Rossellomorea sp. BNER TaxID=2962031 RepID=UPI003AF2C25D|nr:helix-turn-helix domain-containing protein [Rossellomorea sp. BNER]
MEYTELTGFVKNNELDYEKLLRFTNKEFADSVLEDFINVKSSSFGDDLKFRVVQKTGFHEISGNNVDIVRVSVGHSIYSHHYLFNRNAEVYNGHKTIINQEFFENIVRPFHNNIKNLSNRRTALDNVIGVEEASELWDLSPGYIKNLCADRKIIAKKVGKTWIIDRDQPNPSTK